MNQHSTDAHPRNTQPATPTLGTVTDQVVMLARDLATLAHQHDDRRKAGQVAVGTVADLHTIGELLAGVAGVPDTAGEVRR